LVVLDIAQRAGLDLPVVLLDTGLLFPETLALKQQIEARYGIEIRSVKPRWSLRQQAVREGETLWKRAPDRCCELRKVRPLQRVLEELDGWVTGLRRDQSSTRRDVQTVSWDEGYGRVKVNPLAWWSRARVFAYLHAHQVPYNPLLDQGYPSVGCTPCTRPLTVDDLEGDERAGRWAGTGKTECGLHLPPEPTLA
jgi:phosphoadenosine phosphosulfate reductase